MAPETPIRYVFVMAQSKKKPNPSNQDLTASGGSLEKVREILFGQERKTQIEKTHKIERDFNKNLRKAETAIERERAATESRLEQQIAALEAMITAEQAARRKQLATLSKRITKLGETVDGKLATIRKRITRTNGELRTQLEASCAELRESFDEEIAELSESTVEREEVASAFSDLAKKLKRT